MEETRTSEFGERPGPLHGSSSTVRRREHKFDLGTAAAAFLREEIARQLPLYEFYPGHPHTHVTTVYFDTRDRRLFRQAEKSYDDNAKFRVKEYSYQRADGRYLSFPHVFVELKERRDGVVVKNRVPCPKTRVATFLAGGSVIGPVRDLARRLDPGSVDTMEAAYLVLEGFIARHEVSPTSIVSYRRSVYQESEDDLRITFDDQLSVYAAYSGIYGHAEALTPEFLRDPVRRYERVIVEIKRPENGLPAWLAEALRHHHTKRLSKFTTSVRSLLEASPPGFRHNGGRRLDGPGSPAEPAQAAASGGAAEDSVGEVSVGEDSAAEDSAAEDLPKCDVDLDDTSFVNSPIQD